MPGARTHTGAGPRGQLIVVEGPDSFGKSSQVDLLLEALRANGRPAEKHRFPTSAGSSASAALNEYLAHGRAPSGREGKPAEHDPFEIAELFIRDRAEVMPSIEALLERGITVVLSRYWPSTLVFQGQFIADPDARLAFWAWARQEEARLPQPDRTVVLVGDVDVTLASAAQRAQAEHLVGTNKTVDIHEEDSELQKRAERLYRTLAQMYGWAIVEATAVGAWRTREDIAADIRRAVGLADGALADAA